MVSCRLGWRQQLCIDVVAILACSRKGSRSKNWNVNDVEMPGYLEAFTPDLVRFSGLSGTRIRSGLRSGSFEQACAKSDHRAKLRGA
jgi:hypothetical protein